MKLATGFALLTIAVASTYSISANAVDVEHVNGSNPVARCQGALPAFETLIRKRPLAVQNEGTTPAFITCSFESDVGMATIGNAPIMLDTYFSNNTAAPVNLTCTAVSGFQGGTNEFVSQTITITPGTQGNAFWVDTDFEGGLGSGLISISCQLPAGVGVNDTYIFWDAEDLT